MNNHTYHPTYQQTDIRRFLVILLALVLVTAGVMFYIDSPLNHGDVIDQPSGTRLSYVEFTAEALAAAAAMLELDPNDGGFTRAEQFSLAALSAVIINGTELMMHHLARNDLRACEDLVDAINGALYELQELMAKRVAETR